MTHDAQQIAGDMSPHSARTRNVMKGAMGSHAASRISLVSRYF